MKKIYKIIICLLVLAISYYYLKDNFIHLNNLKIKNIFLLFPIALLILLILFINGLILKYLLIPHSVNISLKESFLISVLTCFGNFFMPFRGGAFMRAMYLKKKYKYEVSSFLSGLYGLYALNFLVGSFLGMSVITLLYIFNGIFSWKVFLIYLSIGLFFLMLTTINFRIKSNNKIINVLNKFYKGWQEIKKNRKCLLSTFILISFNQIIYAFLVFIEIKALGFNLSFLKSLYFSAVNNISLLISLTPGSLGIKESLNIFFAKLVDIDSTVIFLYSTLDRASFMLCILVFGLPLYYIIKGSLDENRQ